MSKRYDLVGKRFGKLTVIEKLGSREFKPNKFAIYWKCVCDCGTVRELPTTVLIAGNTKSCGCGMIENRMNLRNYNYKNGISKTRNYHIMSGARARCTNTNRDHYCTYGERGIKFCFESIEEATEYVNTLPNANKGWTIDRIDVNGNYERGNLRWIPVEEQACNKSNSIKITYKNETKTISQWAKDLGKSPYTLYYRHNKGWTDEEVLFGKRL